jgi:L-alanine-DL-glutamate epimerase-like enolase superfamily enzyme
MIDVRSGLMSVPDGPGLGIEPDRELINRYA